MSRIPHSRLGWLQQSILTMLWNLEMYGLEIQRKLRFRGEEVGAGQLYPALKNLEDMNAVSSREEVRVGANRRYYRITEAGKGLLLRKVMETIRFFEMMGIEHFSSTYDDAFKLAGIEPGEIVVDFSNPYLEKFRVKYSQKTGPDGRYYIVSMNEEHSTLLDEWLEFEGLQDSISVVKRQHDAIPLSARSVDIALVLSMLHEDGSDWIISEMRRLLKPTGRGVIADILAVKSNWREEFLPEFMPDHSHTGVDVDVLFSLLEGNQLDVHYQKEERGFLLLIVKPCL